MHPALLIIAQISRTEAASLRPEQTLGSLNLNQSLGLALVRSALERRYQRKLSFLTWKTSIQEILTALDGTGEPPLLPTAGAAASTVPAAVAAPAAATAPAAGALAGAFALGHGIDAQEIASLPETAGNWETHPFYASHFTAAELAAARGRPDIRTHLAGLWCAKEAVKKADPKLLPLAFADIVITHDAAGRPSVRIAAPGVGERIEIVLSITHTPALAFASVLTRRS